MSKEPKQILYKARSKNSRISIYLDGTVTPPLIIVETKRLNDFKKIINPHTKFDKWSVEIHVLKGSDGE